MDCGVCDDRLTGWAGLGVVARLARFLGLPESLAAAVRLQRGCREAQRLLALLYAACAGGGCLRAVDAWGADHVARRAGGAAGVRAAGQPAADAAGGAGVRAAGGYVPVFVDGTAIEVEGRLCEHAEQQYWLHSVFGGAAGVSARLHAGGTDVRGDGREQLDRDVAPLLTAQQPVGLRAASAYSCEALGSSCRQRGWAAAVSGTDPRHKDPLLRQVAAMELREDEGEPLHTESRERAVVVAHQPAGGRRSKVYVVIRRAGDGEQRLLAPVYTVILGSQDRLTLAELVRLHRGKQGQENACQGPLTDLVLQHPPCRSPAANQGFYWGAQIAQLLRQYQVLPVAARRPGLRPLIRYFVGSVGRLLCSARRLRLLCSRGHLPWDWLLHAARRMEPG